VRAFQSVGGSPIFIDHAEGAHLFDVDGNRYLDFCMSWGPLIFGHADPDIAAAAKNAIDNGSSFGAAEATSLELAELICGEIPWVEKIRFVSSGTEAVMSAVRVARGATGRSKVIKFDGCYHGHADNMLVRAGSGLTELTTPDSAGVPPGTVADTLVAPLDDPDAVAKLFADYDGQIAAVIIEPVPANHGLLPQTMSFLSYLRKLCDTHKALLIFDEVITGFRLGFGGAAQQFGVTPDLVTYGKIIGGGFPAGAFAGRADIMDQTAPAGPVYQAGTLSANPVAMAAGLATLEKLQRQQPYAQLEELARLLATQITLISEQRPSIGLNLRSVGSMFWLEFGGKTDTITRSPEQIPAMHKQGFTSFFNAMLDNNIYLAPSPLEIGFLSTAHTEADIAKLLQAIDLALSA
jgi:glutamate-1-semialdehyde 2,1-aminomutase